jgi:hypothetical protein
VHVGQRRQDQFCEDLIAMGAASDTSPFEILNGEAARLAGGMGWKRIGQDERRRLPGPGEVHPESERVYGGVRQDLPEE